MRRRAITKVTLAVLAATAAGCASVLGIPDVTLEGGDAGTDGGAVDATAPHDGSPPPSPDAATESGTRIDAGYDAPPAVDAGADACVPVPQQSWCMNRCGTVADSCMTGTMDCGGCDGGTCISGSCNCDPDPLSTTCATLACGPATNNCQQNVVCPDTCGAETPCGVGGAGPNSCCTPNDPCVGKECGAADDNCGGSMTCTNTCSPTDLCGAGDAGANTCCAPSCASKTCGQSDGCLGTCNTDNGCDAPKSCGGTSCTNDGNCTGGTHTSDCASEPASWLFWNCASKPKNLGSCVQVDQTMYAYAYCCP